MNHLHSRFGIDNFNILEYPLASNEFEMINFFKRLRGESSIGEQGFRGKPVVLKLRNHGVELIFQPPHTCSPELNSCAFCRPMKAYLRQHEQFSINFTKLA